MNAMLSSKCHIITTVRRKQEYEMGKDASGKTEVRKLGLKEQTRDGWEYELTINFQLDTTHLATASKDRTGLFMGKPEFVPTEETGKMIAEWCESGEDPAAEIDSAIEKLKNCSSIDDLKMFRDTLPNYVLSDNKFQTAAKARQAEVSKPPVANTTA